MERITLAHGSGGSLTGELIDTLFRRRFANSYLDEAHDSARLPQPGGRLAFTTDTYVVSPLVFPGADIGKLAICGTVNDLAMSGARPQYISCGFVIEEGLPQAVLATIVESMAAAAAEAGVIIVTGDTKVVNRGAADKLFINTAGIGEIAAGVDICGNNARAGDAVIVSGTLGDHGTAIMLEREPLGITGAPPSDCAPLGGLVAEMLKASPHIHVLRDPTRGGAAGAFQEIARQSRVGIEIFEASLPIHPAVQGISELLGLEPLHLANEGKLIAIVPAAAAKTVLAAMRRHRYGGQAAIIGRILAEPAGRVLLTNSFGSQRILSVPAAEPLPRIC